jgi:isocitrate dehydrogenase
VLLSVHLKATMMKVSDPIMFGQIVEEFYNDVLAKHAAAAGRSRLQPNNGIGDLYARIKDLPADKQAEIEADIQALYAAARPWPWSTPTKASPTCTCRATSSSTPRCRP